MSIWLLRKEAGVGLMDVVIAMVIGAIALLALAAVIPLAGTAGQQGWQRSQAAAIAEDLFERMRTTPYASINSTTFADNDATVLVNYPGFFYAITFSASSPVTNTTTVKITVTYTPQALPTGAGISGSVNAVFTTIFALPTT